ncbi:aminotransferase [Acidisphaera sp. L21]|uniref:aminotransferase n=1 Tax=Acidisphaera sp. L21 TaxID=1641851 RepID=UPI00131E4876|nr:aminotransferase [Acidisphaera sp. L21]
MNPLVENTDSPPIPLVQAWGRTYRQAAGPMIDLCQAVPGYSPHEGFLGRMAAAAADPLNAKYGFIVGDTALREAYAVETGTSVDRVLITAGCNQAFFAALLTLVPRGAAVLLPTPWYYNHKMTCDMLGLEARALPTTPATGFIPDPDEAAALMDGVAAVVLITPNNPTGAIYPSTTIERFAELCRVRGATLLLDETYRDFQSSSAIQPSDDIVRLYSFSKSYAVPGHRIGALTLPSHLVPQAVKVLDCLHICPQRPAQVALAWAVDGLREWREANRQEMLYRALAMRHAFATIPDWQIDSLGAYFAYVRHPFRGTSAWKVTEQLAREYGVLLLPAPAFAGSPDHVRVSFANVNSSGIELLAQRLAAVRHPSP